MKKSKYTEEQMAFAPKQAELGTTVAEVCREDGVARCVARMTQPGAQVRPSSSMCVEWQPKLCRIFGTRLATAQ